jgi:ketosteroid isomerase-like protein
MKTKPMPSRRAQFCALAFVVFASCSPSFAGLPARDEAAIRAQSKKYSEFIRASDWQNAVNVHAEAAVLMPPNERERNGRKEILAWHAALPPMKTFALDILDIDGNADVAFVRGRYSYSASVPNQPDFSDTGKYIEVWRKQRDGSWQIHRDIFNSDKPVAIAAGQEDPAIIKTITIAANAALDSAEAGNQQWLASFSSNMDEVRFLTAGTAPTLAQFRTNWAEAMKPLSRQVMSDRDIVVQVLSPEVAVSFTTAAYQSIGRDGAKSGTVPMAWSAVWKRLNGQWKIVHAHQSVKAEWPSPAGPARLSDAMLEGTWQLNVANSRFSPGPGPRSETRTYTISTDGQQRATYDEVNAEGKRTRSESTFHLDGRDAPITGNPDIDTQAISRTGPRSISAVLKKAGEVVRTATREVSKTGNAMTLHFKGVNAKGQPLDDTWVFDRVQPNGEWLSLRFTTVKPDMIAEFERLQKEELIPALKKGGVTVRAASSYATFGDGYVFAFGQPLKNLAELDEEEPLVKVLGAAAASALVTKLRACHVTTRVLGIRNVADLSWEHDQPLPMFVVERHELAAGRKAEWLAFMREHYVPAVRTTGVKQYIVQETVFGGNANEVNTLRFIERYGDLDAGGLRRNLGNEAYAQLQAKLPAGVVTQTERFVVRTRPDLSIVPAAKPKPTE